MNLSKLQAGGWLPDDRIDEAIEVLGRESEEERKLPWIARFSMGLGAWFAGIFTLAFLFTLLENMDFESELGYLVIGLVILGIGVALIRLRKNVFLDQLALVLAFAGYAMASMGIAEWLGSRDFCGPMILSLVLCPFVYWLSGHLVLRFMSVGWVWFTCFAMAFDEGFLWLLLVSLGAALGFVVAGYSGRLRESLWRPALIATVTALFSALWAMSAVMNWSSNPFFMEAYPAISTILVLGFTCLLWWLERGGGLKATVTVGLFGLVAGAIAYAGAPGVAVALGLMLVAHARGDRWLAGLAVIALTAFLILFYYYLGVSLMAKSLWLMGTGVVLLGLCAASEATIRKALKQSSAPTDS